MADKPNPELERLERLESFRKSTHFPVLQELFAQWLEAARADLERATEMPHVFKTQGVIATYREINNFFLKIDMYITAAKQKAVESADDPPAGPA
jgi:hypothetical protein